MVVGQVGPAVPSLDTRRHSHHTHHQHSSPLTLLSIINNYVSPSGTSQLAGAATDTMCEVLTSVWAAVLIINTNLTLGELLNYQFTIHELKLIA